MKRGGASGNGKERLRDYSVSRDGSPNIPKEKAVSEQAAKRPTIETDLIHKAGEPQTDILLIELLLARIA